MLSRNELGERFALQYLEAENRRVICGKNIVLHCHHYNSRLQHAMENAANVDGRSHGHRSSSDSGSADGT